MFKYGEAVPDDYCFRDNLEKFNLLESRDGVLQSVVPDFYEDFTAYVAGRLANKLSEAEQKSLYDAWEFAYITCNQASNYLKSNDDEIVCHDDNTLARRYKDKSFFEVKKPGRDCRTKEYRDWLNEQPPSVIAEIDYANKHRSRTYKEWKKGENPYDRISDYTWRTRDANIESSNDLDHGQSKDIASKFMEEEKINIILKMFKDDLDKKIIKLLLDGYKHIEIYKLLKIEKYDFYKRLDSIRKILSPLRSGKEIIEPSPLSPTTKICSVCKVEKSIDLFGNDSRNSSGKQARCRECGKARKR